MTIITAREEKRTHKSNFKLAGVWWNYRFASSFRLVRKLSGYEFPQRPQAAE